MNWDALGALGELLGAAGVIVTLVYLAIQVRQNTDAVKTSSLEAVMDSWRIVNREIMLSNADARRALYVGMNDYESLNQDQKQVFNMLVIEYVLVVHNAWQLNQKGIVSKVDVDAWAKFAIGLLRTPGGMEHWKMYRKMYTPTVVEYLDQELAALADQPNLIEMLPHFDVEKENSGVSN